MVEYTLPPEEFAKWVEVGGKPVWDNWVKSMQAKGKKAAPQILEETIRLVKEYSK
jgi:hypothetical protein